MSEPVATLESVTYRYPAAHHAPPALEGISLEIGPQDFVGLIGPNGGGKTTLLRVLLGVLEPQAGTVRVLGRRPKDVARRIGYVPQQVDIDPRVPVSVLDTVLTGRLGLSSWGMRYGRAHHEAARAAMEQAGVADLADRSLSKLSGGQRQRVLIARALAAEVDLLLLDEPMAGVDLHMEQGILETLHRLNERLPIVLVSHDVGFVSAHVKRVACLSRTMVVHAAGEISGDVIADMYDAHGPVHQLHHAPDCPTTHEAPDEPGAGG